MLSILVLFAGCCLLWTISYDSFIDFVLVRTQRENYRDLVVTSVFPENRFNILRAGMTLLILVLFFLVIRFRRNLDHQINTLRSTTRHGLLQLLYFFRSGSADRAGLLLILVFTGIRTVWYIAGTDLIYDECWTYLNFTRHGPLISVLTYPSSNNHILLSLLSSILDMMGFTAPWALRLPVLCFGMGCTILFHYLVRQRVNGSVALLITALFAVSTPVSLYMELGRGYILMCFFYLILLCYHIRGKNPDILWIICACLGFYSIPVFIYPFVLVVGAYLYKYHRVKDHILHMIRACTAVIFITGIMYAPAWLTGSLFSEWERNAHFFAISGQWFDHYTDVYDFIGGFSGGWILVLIVYSITFIRMIRRQEKADWISLSLVALLIPVIISLLQQSALPSRVYTFLAIHWTILVGFWICKLPIGTNWNNRLTLTSISLLMVGLSLWYHYQPLRQNITRDTEDLHRISERLVQEGRNDLYLDYEPIKPILEYQASIRNHSVQIHMAQENSIDYQEFDPAEGYDAVIVSPDSPLIPSLNSSALYQPDTLDQVLVYRSVSR